MSAKKEFTARELALIEEHRYWNVDHGSDWYECTFEDFIEVASAFGIEVTKEDISFSGFSSQGDGASFEFGSTDANKVILAALEVEESKPFGEEPTGYAAEFAALGKLLLDAFSPWVLTCPEGREAAEAFRFWARRNSHQYCHSGTVTVDTEWEELWDSTNLIAPPPFFEALSARIYTPGDRPGNPCVSLQKDIDDQVERIANALYRTLKEGHDYLTSDEAVWESLEANEITVEEDEDLEVAA